jgi:integrase
MTRNGRGYWGFMHRYKKALLTHMLGSAADLSPAAARKKREDYRAKLRGGFVPQRRGIVARAARAEPAPSAERSFASVVEMFLSVNAPTWKASNRAKQEKAYRRLCTPELSPLPVSVVDTSHVLALLNGFEGETRNKHRIMLNNVLAYATAHKLRSGDNPADNDVLKHLLPTKVTAKANHHDAMPCADVPSLIADLIAEGSVEARALVFTIATAARTEDVLGAKWSEISGSVWIISADRMKEGVEHRVPLSPSVVKFLGKPGAPGEYVFGSRRYGPTKPMWHSSLRVLLKTVRPGTSATVHGMRSTFSGDWALKAKYPVELRDMALAHAVGDAVRQAYNRPLPELYLERAPMMQAWSKFLGLR